MLHASFIHTAFLDMSSTYQTNPSISFPCHQPGYRGALNRLEQDLLISSIWFQCNLRPVLDSLLKSCRTVCGLYVSAFQFCWKYVFLVAPLFGLLTHLYGGWRLASSNEVFDALYLLMSVSLTMIMFLYGPWETACVRSVRLCVSRSYLSLVDLVIVESSRGQLFGAR